MAFLTERADAKQDHGVRRALAQPGADGRACATVAVLSSSHLNKDEQKAVRCTGSAASIGLVGAARSLLLFGRDPDDPDDEHGSRRLLAHAKCNWARLQPHAAATSSAVDARARRRQLSRRSVLHRDGARDLAGRRATRRPPARRGQGRGLRGRDRRARSRTSRARARDVKTEVLTRSAARRDDGRARRAAARQRRRLVILERSGDETYWRSPRHRGGSKVGSRCERSLVGRSLIPIGS